MIMEGLPRETPEGVTRSKKGKSRKPHKGRIWGTVSAWAIDLCFHTPSPLNNWLRAALPSFSRPSEPVPPGGATKMAAGAATGRKVHRSWDGTPKSGEWYLR